jgi:outer membrane lipoprotein-sorting protein
MGDSMRSSRACLAFPIVILAFFASSHTPARTASDSDSLLKNMESAYAQVTDYQTNIEVKTYSGEGSFAIQKFLYTFKKSDRIRLDFETPHSGMVLVYPDQNGKVVLRPPGLGRFFTLHLAPDNSFLRMSSGQRVDQTDLGLLIKNIGHSLTDQRRGPAEFAEDDGNIRVRVLADDHFQKGVETLYQFLIDKKLWLPAEVEESTPESRLERKIIFHNLRINTGVPDSFFRMDG